MALVGLILATLLIALGVGTALRQKRTRIKLATERFLPSDDRLYLRNQVRRRYSVAVVLISIGSMIGWYYLSGMDDQMNQIIDRRPLVEQDGVIKQQDLPNLHAAEDKDFARSVMLYWIIVLVMVFVVACLAIFDFWATRRYWMAQYKLIKTDHETKLRRDLAVYRQAKDNDRLTRLRDNLPDDKNQDDTDENPPTK